MFGFCFEQVAREVLRLSKGLSPQFVNARNGVGFSGTLRPMPALNFGAQWLRNAQKREVALHVGGHGWGELGIVVRMQFQKYGFKKFHRNMPFGSP